MVKNSKAFKNSWFRYLCSYSREYFVEPDTYIRMEVDDYCGWSYKFRLKNTDRDEH